MGPKVKKAGKKKIAEPPLATKTVEKVKDPRFVSTPKNFSIGGDVLPKRDLTRYVRWPKFVVLQRQKAILQRRLKIPPALNQFNYALDKGQAGQLLKLLKKYSPETREQKKERLMAEAQARVDGKEIVKSKKPILLKCGINHVTELVEQKIAKLVVIPHDVDPIELVVWLPTLCRKKNVPYCIIKGKGRLGPLVHQPKSTAVALCACRKEDQNEFDKFVTLAKTQFNDNVEVRRKWGGGELSRRSQHKKEKRQKLIDEEQYRKAGLMH